MVPVLLPLPLTLGLSRQRWQWQWQQNWNHLQQQDTSLHPQISYCVDTWRCLDHGKLSQFCRTPSPFKLHEKTKSTLFLHQQCVFAVSNPSANQNTHRCLPLLLLHTATPSQSDYSRIVLSNFDTDIYNIQGRPY